MAAGRTISANFLTDRDKQVIALCRQVSQATESLLTTTQRLEYVNNFGKIHAGSRDAGAGRGAGKLQRDALCTRGIGGKAPLSNRNLRWHPLVSAAGPVKFARTVERVEIEGGSADSTQTLIFVVKDESGQERAYPADRVHELPARYAVLPEHWSPHAERLRFWNDTLWTQNSCVITAFEACDWHHAVETYAVLNLSAAINFFSVPFDTLYQKTVEILRGQTVDPSVALPSADFPRDPADILGCPLCKMPPSENPAGRPDRARESRWKPAWGGNKRGEGEDSSMQIMHVEPLTEAVIRHTGANVRFGHRWCNVAMSDHSIRETVEFMDYVVKVHKHST